MRATRFLPALFVVMLLSKGTAALADIPPDNWDTMTEEEKAEYGRQRDEARRRGPYGSNPPPKSEKKSGCQRTVASGASPVGLMLLLGAAAAYASRQQRKTKALVGLEPNTRAVP